MFNCSPLPSDHLNHARITPCLQIRWQFLHMQSADHHAASNYCGLCSWVCRADVRQKIRKKISKHCTPAVIMNDIRSLANKMDELETLAWIQKEYKECSIMCFTETRPHKQIPDSHATLSGFHTVGGDPTASGKNTGGGLSTPDGAIWNILYLCSSAIKLIAIGLRPYYQLSVTVFPQYLETEQSRIHWCLHHNQSTFYQFVKCTTRDFRYAVRKQ